MPNKVSRDKSSAPAVSVEDHASLCVLGDHGVFFSAARQELQLFNGPATYVWCKLEDGHSPRKIISAYAALFGVLRQTAETQVGELLRRWQGLGDIDWIGPPPSATIDLTTALGRLLVNPSLRRAFAASPHDVARRLALRDTDIEAFAALDAKALEDQARMLEEKKRKFRDRRTEIGNAARPRSSHVNGPKARSAQRDAAVIACQVYPSPSVSRPRNRKAGCARRWRTSKATPARTRT